MSTTAKPLLSDAADGEVSILDDTMQVVFHRHYPKPIEKVWAALTTPERLADWFAQAEVDLRVGGEIRLSWAGVHKTTVVITACDPPHALAWQWTINDRPTLVRFDLRSDGAGCALTLTHSGLSAHAGPGAGVRAGWHAHLEGLADALEGLADALEGQATPWAVKSAREHAVADRYPPLPA